MTVYTEIAGMLFDAKRIRSIQETATRFGFAVELSDFRVIQGDLTIDGMSPEEWIDAMTMD